MGRFRITVNGVDLTYVNGGDIVARVLITKSGAPSYERNQHIIEPLSNNVYALVKSVSNDDGKTINVMQGCIFTIESSGSYRYGRMIGTWYQFTPYVNLPDNDLVNGPNAFGYDTILSQDVNYTRVVVNTRQYNGHTVHSSIGSNSIGEAKPFNETYHDKMILENWNILTSEQYYSINIPDVINAIIDGGGVSIDDPYSGAGTADVGGGGGDFDDTSVDIDFPALPSISAADAGFISILSPSLTQIKALSDYMWGSSFDLDQVKKIFANPIDAILGLSIVPVPVSIAGSKRIHIGAIDTGIDMPVVDSQFVDVDFGTLEIKTGTGGSYLDYAPYTKAQIFIPYVGFRDISIDDVMGKTLHLKFRVDLLSGGCVAFLKCGGSVLYEFTGQCAINLPLTNTDYTNTIRGAMGVVSAVMGTAAGVGMGVATGNPLQVAGSAINGISSAASDVMGSKPAIQKSGSLAGASGVLGHQYAFVVLTRPALQRPENQRELMGYPSFVSKTVGQLSGTGFNAFSVIKLEGLGLTDSEMRELENIMREGVYL